MIQSLVRKLLGGTDRFAKRQSGLVDKVNQFSNEFKNLNLAQIKDKANTVRQELTNGANKEDKLPIVFALAREAASQTLNMRHFDVQLIGGYALHSGMIAEMKTGEGKTLAATLPACLAALTNEQVHIVTVNDYLASRDANWMKPVYESLGLTVGVTKPAPDVTERKKAYEANIVYGTNNQFGFDYLNDNMVHELDKLLQKKLDFAIVDEVDSILIDEARTPLAISGIAQDHTNLYQVCDAISREFKIGGEEDQIISNDFAIDEKTRQIHFSDEGYEKAEEVFAKRKLLHDGGLYEAHNLSLMHHLISALRARYLFKRDKDYVVRNNRVVVVDEHTGRLMPGRRWGDGLHQAIEAKEGVAIEPETQTLASVSLQNYYRGYKKLAGMTGTATTEAQEFKDIYGLEVATIPTHQSMIRTDQIDLVFARRKPKLTAIIKDIKNCIEKDQPVLVGTTTIESSEEISTMLEKEKILHEVLNAKQHEREAEIIAQAGMPGKVTISTSMAGRGTDIVLGGNINKEKEDIENNEEYSAQDKESRISKLNDTWKQTNQKVIDAGGLRIIGTERHEARRIDNQLRGRSGRQGDPGSSVFYLSFEDPLLRIFADAKFSGILERLMADDDEPLEAGMVSRVIEKAQQRMEAYNYDIRKQLLEYDDITNEQRKIIYQQRREILEADDISLVGTEFATVAVEEIIEKYIDSNAPEEEWEVAAASNELKEIFKLDYPIQDWLDADENLVAAGIIKKAVDITLTFLTDNLAKLGKDSLRFQKSLILEVLDTNWRLHLSALDHLRQGIGLRGFAQKNPKQEYRRESLTMFNAMLVTIRQDTTKILLAVKLKEPTQEVPKPIPQPQPQPQENTSTTQANNVMPKLATKPKRNDPCPCGSGLKYKHCHGKSL